MFYSKSFTQGQQLEVSQSLNWFVTPVVKSLSESSALLFYKDAFYFEKCSLDIMLLSVLLLLCDGLDIFVKHIFYPNLGTPLFQAILELPRNMK